MLICDSESDNFKFESTKIWVIASKAVETGMWYFSFDESIDFEKLQGQLDDEVGVGKYVMYTSHNGFIDLVSRESVCFHNYFQHDKPLIKRFYPDFQPKEEHDSYILSQLFNPDRGLHGLDSWAKRLRGEEEGKVVHEEWDKFSPAMLKRVIDDVKVNVLVWEALMEEKKEWEDAGGSWDEAIKIEYGIADLQGRQELMGVLLDQDKAYALADEIYTDIQVIDSTLLKEMPLRVIRGSEVTAPFRKDGQLKEVVRKWWT